MLMPLLSVCVFLSHQANPTPTTHTPSREACYPIVGKVLPLVCTRRLHVRLDIIWRKMPLMVSFRRTGTTGLFKSVDPSASPATSFVSPPGSDVSPLEIWRCLLCLFRIQRYLLWSSAGSGGASCVPLRGLAAPPVFPFCVLTVLAAAPAPALVLRAAEHLFSRLFRLHSALRRGPHRQHRCCRSCQARQSTAPPAIFLSPVSAPRRAPTGPSSRFSLPKPFSALSPHSRARAHGVPPPYHALSPPAPAPPLASAPVSYLRRAPTGPLPLL